MLRKYILLLTMLGVSLVPVRMAGQTAHPAAVPTPASNPAEDGADLPDDDSDTPARPPHLPEPGMKPPVLIHSVQLKYTKSARKQHLTGIVRVETTVDTTGMPQNLSIEKGLGNELDDLALQAVRQYRFKPATKYGQPVPVKLYIQVQFDIRDREE